MLAEISVQPQVGRDIRPEVTGALEEIEHAGMRYEVEPFGTVVEGDLSRFSRRFEASTAALTPME